MDERTTDAPPAAHRTGHLPTLDGWRGVAVLMVIAAHAFGPRLSRFGELGVSIFFALSGLLICSRLIAESDRRGRIDLPAFFVRRVFRILPPALLYLIALAVMSMPVADGELMSCVAFWRNYFVGGLWYTSHYWSLAVEEHFYLVFPLMLVLAGPRRRIAVTAVTLAVLQAWRLYLAHWPCPVEWLGRVWEYVRTDCRLGDLLFGAMTWLVFAHSPARVRTTLATFSGVIVLAVICHVRLPWLVVSLSLPWLLMGTVVQPNGVPGRVLEWTPLARLGRMSYSLYLWQQLFFDPHHLMHGTGLAWIQEWPWNMLGLAATATTSHLIVERPLTALGRQLARRVSSVTNSPTLPAASAERRAA